MSNKLFICLEVSIYCFSYKTNHNYLSKHKGVCFVNCTQPSCLPKCSRNTFHIPIWRATTLFSKVNHNWCSMVCTLVCFAPLSPWGGWGIEMNLRKSDKCFVQHAASSKCKARCKYVRRYQDADHACTAIMSGSKHNFYWGSTTHTTWRCHNMLTQLINPERV